MFCFQAEGSQGPPGDKVESNDEGIMEEKGHARTHACTAVLAQTWCTCRLNFNTFKYLFSKLISAVEWARPQASISTAERFTAEEKYCYEFQLWVVDWSSSGGVVTI